MLSKKAGLLLLLFLLSGYVQFVVLFQPSKIEKRFKFYKSPETQTLNRAMGQLINKTKDVRVLKIKKGDKIYLEFLSQQDNGGFTVINKIQIKGSREAYYNYWPKKTAKFGSLIILDDNGDGELDLLAPTYDKFFLPKLNIATYNQNTKKFELQNVKNYTQVVPRGFHH